MKRIVTRFILATIVGAASVGAQVAPPPGVLVVGKYNPGDTPGIAVLPVRAPLGDSIQAILLRDLDNSNRFSVVRLQGTDPATFRTAANGRLNFKLFAQLGIRVLVEVSPGVGGGLHLSLYDVAGETIPPNGVQDFNVLGQGLSRDWRLSIHAISDKVQEFVTGDPGIAATRISYIRGNRIWVIDSDGAMEISLPIEGTYGLSPAWNPAGDRLVYTTFGDDGSKMVTVDPSTGASRVIIPHRRNYTVLTPAYSPDGSAIAYAVSGEDGTSDIHLVSGPTAVARRLTSTRGASINQAPTFSPDGRYIAFTSDRLGHKDVYIMDADGTNQELLYQFSDFNTQPERTEPDWSPDGRLVALAGRVGGRNGSLQIVTVNRRDGTSKVWTSGPDNEQPSWAPDGKHIVFTSRRSGVRQLWILDTETARVRQLTKSDGAKMAAWSPRLAAGR